MPDEIRAMRFRDAVQILIYWQDAPPEQELLAIMARYRNPKKQLSPEEEQKQSLEARWKSGAMNPKQFFEATGGLISLKGETGIGTTGPKLPGIGPFPGAR